MVVAADHSFIVGFICILLSSNNHEGNDKYKFLLPIPIGWENSKYDSHYIQVFKNHILVSRHKIPERLQKFF
jgi:hypothetical protein